MSTQHSRAAIIGIGEVKAGRYPDRTEVDMAMEAIVLALRDAGVDKSDVQGVFTTPDLRPSIGLQLNMLCEYLRLSPLVMAEVTCGAIAAGLAIHLACNEIALGHIEVAVCYGAEREGSIGWYKKIGEGEGSTMFEPSSMQPYGSRGAIWAYALSARRYMHETGATEEDFARAAVRNRKNAASSPMAAITKPITVDDVLRSPPICSPIKMLDAPVSLDGAAAVVVASEDYARRAGANAVRIAGIGMHYDSSVLVPSDGCDTPISSFVSVQKAAERAAGAAGIPIDDIDVAELYAPFSSHELMVPEDIGWFPRGGMIEALRTGETEVGGRIPINTDGGLLARGHPWGVTPFYETATIVKQLRGAMGPLQVAGARTGLVHCEAGMLNDSLVMILEKL